MANIKKAIEVVGTGVNGENIAGKALLYKNITK